MIYRLKNKIPQIGKNNFIAENSTLIGDIKTGENVSIWFSAVLRGDCSSITVGNNSNIQDNVTVHGDSPFPVTIGDGVTIGHNCVIHGCTIGNNVIVGMGAILLNGSTVPENCIVAAGAVVTEKLVANPGSLIVGSPAKVIRELSEENISYIKYAKDLYVEDIELYKELVPVK